MTKKTSTNTRPAFITTTELAKVQGGFYFRSNVWGDTGKELDAGGDVSLYDGGTSLSDIKLDTRKGWIG